MDLKLYYQKIREAEAKIVHDCAVVVSKETADGGKEGTFTEVARRVAAKLIVEGLARLATAAEARLFQETQAEARRVAEQVAAAGKIQLAVLSSAEVQKLRGPAQSQG